MERNSLAKSTDEVYEEIVQLRNTWVNTLGQYPPRLYHYTNSEGLRSILETRRIWASSIWHMNDPTEVQYSSRIVREAAVEARGRFSDTELERLFDWRGGTPRFYVGREVAGVS